MSTSQEAIQASREGEEHKQIKQMIGGKELLKHEEAKLNIDENIEKDKQYQEIYDKIKKSSNNDKVWLYKLTEKINKYRNPDATNYDEIELLKAKAYAQYIIDMNSSESIKNIHAHGDLKNIEKQIRGDIMKTFKEKQKKYEKRLVVLSPKQTIQYRRTINISNDIDEKGKKQFFLDKIGKNHGRIDKMKVVKNKTTRMLKKTKIIGNEPKKIQKIKEQNAKIIKKEYNKYLTNYMETKYGLAA